MTQGAASYAAVLLSLGITPEAVTETETVFSACPELTEILDSPVVSPEEKTAVIDKLFPAEIQSFLKVVCQNGQINSIPMIVSEYRSLERQQKQCAYAVLEYVTPLTETQLAAMKRFVCARTGKPDAEIQLRQNPELLGGFVLKIGDETVDKSMRRAVKEMRKRMIRR